MKTMKTSRLSLLTRAIAVIIGVGCCSVGFAQNRSLTIGTYPFPEDIAITHVWKQLLEKKGYQVTIKQASRPIVVSGVAHGSFDLALELWLPYTDKNRYDAVKNQVSLIGPWYDKAWQGLAVPDYMHIKTIAALHSKASEFDKKLLYTAGPGAVVTQHAKNAIKQYDLPFKARVSTEPAALAELSRAYQKHKPVVITLWHPHWAWAQYHLHMLKDPKHVFTKPNHIYAYAHKGFKKTFPKVADWLSNFHLSSKQLSQLMNSVRQANSPAQAASRWISNNKSVWRTWFTEG